MNQYKINFTSKERELLTKSNRKDLLEYDGVFVSKKTYNTILATLNSLKNKEYGASV